VAGQQYQGKYTHIILKKVEMCLSTVDDIIEQKRTYDHMVNDHGMQRQDSYATSLNEALTILQSQP
jgi:hypothetical protein